MTPSTTLATADADAREAIANGARVEDAYRKNVGWKSVTPASGYPGQR